jgi:hypothetical protein
MTKDTHDEAEVKRLGKHALPGQLERVFDVAQVVDLNLVGDAPVLAAFDERSVPGFRIGEQPLLALVVEVEGAGVYGQHVRLRRDVQERHALFLGEGLADAVIVEPDADAVADLGDHARAAAHHAVDHLVIDRWVAGGAPLWVADVHVRDRGARIVAVVKIAHDFIGLLGQGGIGLLAVQAAGGRDGDDNLARVRQVRFHGTPPVLDLPVPGAETAILARPKSPGHARRSDIQSCSLQKMKSIVLHTETDALN